MRSLKKNLLLSIPVLALAACGTMIGGQTQRITLQTPGAYEARCTLDNGNRYVMEPGESIEIMRSQNDLVVDCYASGDRHVVKRVESGYNDWSTANIANGVIPGMAYDRVSKGINEYPDVIIVDFTGVPTRGFELPAYHNKDAPSPYAQAVEDFGPNTPKVPTDGTHLRRGVEKLDYGMVSNPFAGYDAGGARSDAATPEAGTVSKSSGTASSSASSQKGELKGGTAEELTRSMNPSVFGN